jgi:hypothetical protein
MSRRSRILIFVVPLIIGSAIIGIPPAMAQWIEGGVELALSFQSPMFHRLCPDGEGGAIIVRCNTGNILAHRIDAHGRSLWAAGGIDICDFVGYASGPEIIPDGTGGAIIAFNVEHTNSDIWAQRIDADGNLLWGANGDSICTAPGNQYIPSLAADGTGGAIIAWEDLRGSDHDIYAQHVDADGAIQWTPDGIAVCSATGNQMMPETVSDGNGGALICWVDERDGISLRDVYAQHVHSYGTVHWATDGVALSTATGRQIYHDMASDAAGGAIAVWQDEGAGSVIKAQRIDQNGNVKWTTDGVQLGAGLGGGSIPKIMADGSGGAVVAWRDMGLDVDGDIFAQRIDAGGNIQWGVAGVAVCTADRAQTEPRLTTDGAGGAIVTWYDGRAFNNDIYAQRVNAAGNAVWTADGAPICTAGAHQYDPEIASDDEGGAIIVWRDGRNESTHAYAQRIERNGYWGYPAGSIFSCNDIPGDQGGFVSLAWHASRLDPWPEMQIAYYTLWRAIDNDKALTFGAANPPVWIQTWDVTRDLLQGVCRLEEGSKQHYFWELVEIVDAYHLGGYARTVPTLFDSSAVSNRPSYFQVIAHGVYPEMFWISAPDSGYSVDNLAPAAPKDLAGAASYTPSQLTVSWRPNTETDLSHYAIYRGTTPEFQPDPLNLVATVTDTVVVDAGWNESGSYYYKVAAWDIHGNEGLFALLPPDHLTGACANDPPAQTRLIQNAPNPFNPMTTIQYDLSQPRAVTLCIYDLSGRRVRTLRRDVVENPGRHEVTWRGDDDAGQAVASGVYFCRFEAGGYAATRSMILIR